MAVLLPYGAAVLVERDDELNVVETALAEACLRRGGALLVAGPAGIGKTALLQAARERAADRGMRTLAAAGGELERELAFSVVQQMFDPLLRSLATPVRDDVLSGAAGLARPVFGAGSPAGVTAAGPAAVNAVVHGLYWVCSNLADSGPLLLVVDDLHVADEASLRFLSYLARRVADLPILLVLAGRPVPPEHPVAQVLEAQRPRRLDLAPLSGQAVSILVRETLSVDADDRFCQACATASGGNPFLLTEALRSLQADGTPPTAGEAGRVERLRPETISRAVLSRVARAGPDALRLARAVAVLGPAADLRRVAALAGVSARTAAELLDRLAAESIIRRRRRLVEFVHPLVRTAVYADSGEFTRAADHKRAAGLLHDDGVPAEELVPHLLAAEPESDPWVVQNLRDAAASAMARGAPEVAAPCLRRALAEPPDDKDRLPILIQLGRSLGMANRPDEAAETLRSAYELAGQNGVRVDIALELGTLMIHTGRGGQARVAHELARTAVHDEDLENSAKLTAVFAATALASFEPPANWIARLDDIIQGGHASTDIRRVAAASLAYGAAATGDRSADEVARIANLAAAGPIPSGHEWHLANFAGAALTIADRLPAAIDLHDRAIAAARERGDVAEFRYLAALRSHVMLYAGRLAEAEADGRAAYVLRDDRDADRDTDPDAQDTPLGAAVLVNALVERGALTEAEQVLSAAGLAGELSLSIPVAHFGLLARGRLRLRQGRVPEALADLRGCGEVLTGTGYVNPGFALWRPEIALAYLRLGDVATARQVAAENVELSRKFGAPLPTGLALHTAALVEGGTAGSSLMEQAVAVLQASTTDLWRGRVLVDYGAALRRAGQRRRAQQPLRTGLDIAARCGATALADRAAEELVAAGGRPRRARLTGPESLTASELRVARLAAGGATNREIAQALFVSLRTVEFHLTHAYRKLGISTRQKLASALRQAG